ncbi:MAG: hypothetical protein ACT4OP_00120 [Actinomycetota bacterium]
MGLAALQVRHRVDVLAAHPHREVHRRQTMGVACIAKDTPRHDPITGGSVDTG